MLVKLFRSRKEYVSFRRLAKRKIEKLCLERVRMDGKKKLKLTYYCN